MQTVLNYALVPCVTFIVGGITAKIRKPSDAWCSVIQHFASGVVFAVVAVDLLPDIIKSHDPYEVGIGFSAGVFLMLLIRAYAERVEAAQDEKSQHGVPYAMLGAVGVDVLVDGFLIGVSFAANEQAGQFLTVALGLEMFSLGLALSISLGQTVQNGLSLLIIIVLGQILVASAVTSHFLIQFIPATSIPLLLAFGLAALLYLVTEELLHKAHQLPDNAYITATFFIGFLLFLILSMLH